MNSAGADTALNFSNNSGNVLIAFGVGKTGRDTVTASIYKFNSEFISVSGGVGTVLKSFTGTVQLVDSGLGSSWVRFYHNSTNVISGTSSKQITFNTGDTFYSQSYQDPSINYSGSTYVIYK